MLITTESMGEEILTPCPADSEEALPRLSDTSEGESPDDQSLETPESSPHIFATFFATPGPALDLGLDMRDYRGG